MWHLLEAIPYIDSTLKENKMEIKEYGTHYIDNRTIQISSTKIFLYFLFTKAKFNVFLLL